MLLNKIGSEIVFKYEMHLHTSQCSACSVSSYKEMVEAAVKNEYSGFFITNHFYNGNTCVDKNLPYNEFIKAYADDFYNAYKYGEKYGIKVFFGIEEVYAPGKEMLIYGLKPEELIEFPYEIKITAEKKTEFVHKKGGIVTCAHPYRDRTWIKDFNTEPDISIFDAIECFNYSNNPDENEKAFEFAKLHNLIGTSGGDVHNANKFGHSGVAMNKQINSSKDFIEQILANEFKLIVNGNLL